MDQQLLTKEQFEIVVDKIKENINIPIFEDMAVRFILSFTLNKAEDLLPDDWEESIKTSIKEGSLENLIDKTVDLLNEKINIPFIGEESERKILKPLISAIVEALSQAIFYTIYKIEGDN